MSNEMHRDEWDNEVHKLIEERTGCTWDDLCGDEEPLNQAYYSEDTPEEFVDWFMLKYDLVRVDLL